MANGTIVLGMNVPAKLPKARSVQVAGKSVTDSSPMTTKASPRKSASVPIVTASEGSPSRVTRTPLNAPHSAPANRQIGMMSSSGSPRFHRSAISALDRASTDATERSISAATITSVSASAISATSDRSSEPVVKESVVRNSLEMPWPKTAVSTSSPISSASQRPSMARRRAPPVAVGSASRAGAPVVGGVAVVSAGTACAPPAKGGLDAQGDEAVEGDGQQQQGPDRGLLPERGDLEHDQRRRDRAQQQRAHRRAVDAAGAAEDRHAADDGGRDDGQLVAEAGRRVDRAEARGEEDAAET